MASKYYARVAAILSPYQLVINRGDMEGMKSGDRVVVFAVGGSIRDPETGKDLGALEIVRGVAEVVHVQEHMSTIESRSSSPIEHAGRLNDLARLAFVHGEVTSKGVSPFRSPEVGDFVRKIVK